jgi:hypothetical protein
MVPAVARTGAGTAYDESLARGSGGIGLDLGGVAHVAQGIERRFPKPCVASSNLAVGALTWTVVVKFMEVSALAGQVVRAPPAASMTRCGSQARTEWAT